MSTKLPQVADFQVSAARQRKNKLLSIMLTRSTRQQQNAYKGDLVLLERSKENKLSPHYEEPIYQVTEHYEIKSSKKITSRCGIQVKHSACQAIVTPVIKSEELSLADPAVIPHERHGQESSASPVEDWSPT